MVVKENYSQESQGEGLPPLFLIHFQFSHPIFSLLGLVGNSWILLILAFGEINISKRTKFYYWILAVADLSISVCNFAWGELCYSLWIWTAGNVYFCIDAISSVTCSIMNLWYYESELISNYLLVALSIERMIAVCWPLKAKFILTKKFTFNLLFFLIVPGFLFYGIVIPLSSYNTNTILLTCAIDNFRISGILYNISMPIIIFGLHTIIDLVVSSIIFIKLSLSRTNIGIHQKFKQNSRESSTTLTLLFLCIINIIIYGLCLLAYFAKITINYIFKDSPQLWAFTYAVFIVFGSSTILTHGANIIVYMALIPSFRHSALCKLTKFKKIESTHTSILPSHLEVGTSNQQY